MPGQESVHTGSDVTFARGMNEEGKFGGLISRKSISNWGQGRG